MRTVLALTAGIALAMAAALPYSAGVELLEERQATPDPDDCMGLHFIVARGSYENPGTGCIGSVSNIVCNELDDCDAYGIDYPATMYNGANYVASETAGVVAMIAAAHAYHQSCPRSAIVLMGYSQGAQVVADTVCGNSEHNWIHTDPISGWVRGHIIAAVIMGDPSFIADTDYDIGSSVNNGTVIGRNTSTCDPFANRIQSYCDEGDPYCASGDNITVHHDYMNKYKADAADYVVSQYSSYLDSRKHWTSVLPSSLFDKREVLATPTPTAVVGAVLAERTPEPMY